jgi:hypothetical protein
MEEIMNEDIRREVDGIIHTVLPYEYITHKQREGLKDKLLFLISEECEKERKKGFELCKTCQELRPLSEEAVREFLIEKFLDIGKVEAYKLARAICSKFGKEGER